MTDTIFALSTGTLPTGVAIVRLSGPLAGQALADLTGQLPPPRQARLRFVRDPATDDLLDKALVVWFPGPASATGEDCSELHLHGSRAVVQDVLRVLGTRPGCRPAEAGEFTRRAFLSGKLDLTAVEGLADLLAAETSAQRRQALRQADGGLATRYEAWRNLLLRARALVEAELDFPDEEDVPGAVSDQAWTLVRQLHDEIGTHLADGHRGERLRTGVQVIIIGAPNAGKSSLLNAIVQRDIAIVSNEAGTTRDVLEAYLDLGGVPVTLVDTAGLREADGSIEREGIRRTRRRVVTADLVLWLTDSCILSSDSGALDHLSDFQEFGLTFDSDVWRIATKSDLLTSIQRADVQKAARHLVSVHTGDGLDILLDDLGAVAETLCASDDEVLLSRERHRSGLERSVHALALAVAGSDLPLELRVEHLREAGDELGRLTGRIDVEELLGMVFSEFCIGK